MSRRDSISSAISTIPTAPSTIRWRAAMIAPACCRCSIACGDLRRVGEVADARFDHLDAGLGQPLLDLLLQVLGDRGGVAAQRHLRLVVRVVGVAGRQVAQRRLGLHLDVVVVVVHLEDRLGGVDDPPDDDRGDLDRVAVVVVDLEVRALEVADAQRDPLLGVERVGPAQARRASPCPT